MAVNSHTQKAPRILGNPQFGFPTQQEWYIRGIGILPASLEGVAESSTHQMSYSLNSVKGIMNESCRGIKGDARSLFRL